MTIIRFKLFGLLIQIDFLFIALVAIFLLVDKTGVSAIALLACLIHELGHILMFLCVGYQPKKLAFQVTGICLTKPTATLDYKKEVLVQLAGSFANFIVFILLSHSIDRISQTSILAVTCLVIGIFNLLPIKSFDGGKLLELILLQFFSIRTTDIVCTIADFLCIFIMLICSIYAYFTSQKTLTLIVLTIYLMLTAVMKLNAKERT